MELSRFPVEIQNCIEKMQMHRNQYGDPGYDYCQRLLEYAAEENSAELFSLGYYHFAEHYIKESDSSNALHCLTEGTKYFRKAKMYEQLSGAYNMMGILAETQNNRVVALDYYYTAMQFAEKYQHPHSLALAETNISSILFYMKQYDQAIQNNKSAIWHYQEAGDAVYRNWNIALSCTRIGQCYVELGDTTKAVEVYDKLVQWIEEEPNWQYPQINIAMLEACCQELLGNQMDCESAIQRALWLMEGKLSLIESSDSIRDMARLLNKLKDQEKTQEFLQIMEEKGIRNHLALWLDIYPCWFGLQSTNGYTEEYEQSTRQYFQLYEQYLQENHQAAVRIVELRERLRNIEREQGRMMAYNQELQMTSQQDPMTGLANRTWLNAYLFKRFEEAYKDHTILGVELMDIDYFKQYNDTYGHLAGDACIEKVANVLKEAACEGVFCARYGGDEFMVIYSGLTEEEITKVVVRIDREVRKLKIPHRTSLCGNTISISQGVFCRVPEEGNREWDFNTMADMALYEVKRAGRNHYKIKTQFSNTL